MPIPKPISAFWQTTDKKTVRLFQGDVLAVLKRLPAKSVQMVVTSPPYYGLRDYGTAEWEGGDESCNHIAPGQENANRWKAKTYRGLKGVAESKVAGIAEKLAEEKGRKVYYKVKCGKCGAKRIDQQIGSESSSQEFVAKMVEVFSAVRRVLRDDGTLWLNFGDCYSSGANSNRSPDTSDEWDYKKSYAEKTGCDVGGWGAGNRTQGASGRNYKSGGLKSGNLMGMPWRVALALQADGWILRQDIIWAKPSPMPESVRNRCTKAHEYIFLFAKRSGYFYDADAIREEEKNPGASARQIAYQKRNQVGKNVKGDLVNHSCAWGGLEGSSYKGGRNKRSVWNVDDSNDLVRFLAENYPEALDEFVDDNKLSTWRIASEAYPGAHFATFPRKLIEPCILAGTSAKGACVECGAPWKRVTEEKKLTRERPNDYVKRTGAPGTGNSCANSVAGVDVKTVGWEPTCLCNGKFVTRKAIADKRAEGVIPAGWDENLTSRESNTKDSKRTQKEKQEEIDGINNKPRTVTTVKYVSKLALENHPVRPCIVLDPFVGSGTTCVVALDHGLRSWGIDLSKDYLVNNAIPRVEGVLLMTPALVHLMRIKPVKLTGGKCLVPKKTQVS